MRLSVLMVCFALVAAACSSSTDTADNEVSAPAPLFVPGVVTTGVVEIDAVNIDYVMLTPEGFTVGDRAPVVLALPPGGQDLAGAQNTVARVYEREALRRGWVVVSPAAPGGQLYFEGSEALVPGLISWIKSWVDAQGGAVHLAGVSNGGISAFRIAAENPDDVRSIVVFPGFARSGDDQQALADLADVPVRMFVGQNDTDWVLAMVDTEERLVDAGGDVTLEVVPGEGHIIASLWDGQRIFDELDAVR